MAMANLKNVEVEGRMDLGEDHHLMLKFSLKALPVGKDLRTKRPWSIIKRKATTFTRAELKIGMSTGNFHLSFAVRAYFPV